MVSQTQSTTRSKRQSSEAVALQVLDADNPLNIHIEHIGEREYAIQELSVQGFLDLSELVRAEADVLGEAGFFSQKTYDDLRQSADYTGLVKKVGEVWRRAPHVVGRFLAIVCSAEREDDADYILRHMKLFSQLPRVIRTFMQLNPWEDLVEDFFQIGAEFRTKVAQLRDTPEQGAENPGTSSQS